MFLYVNGWFVLQVLEIGATTMVVSVPRELSSDHSAVLLLAEASGRVTEAEITDKLRWDSDRPRRVLQELMQVNATGDLR